MNNTEDIKNSLRERLTEIVYLGEEAVEDGCGCGSGCGCHTSVPAESTCCHEGDEDHMCSCNH